MKKVLIIVIIVILLGVFFLFPFIPSDSVYMTKEQKENNKIWCDTGMCGLISYYTPFMYMKHSIQNMLLPPQGKLIIKPGWKPEVPAPKN